MVAFHSRGSGDRFIHLCSRRSRSSRMAVVDLAGQMLDKLLSTRDSTMTIKAKIVGINFADEGAPTRREKAVR